jgi:hypothetical protein
VVKASCDEFFVRFWCCDDWRDIIWVCWVFDVVVPGIRKVVPREDVCLVGVVDLVETAVVEVVPPVFSVNVEKLNGCLVSVRVLVKIPGVNALAP